MSVPVATEPLYWPKYANSQKNMDAIWEQELTLEQEQAMIQRLSQEIKRRRMEVPAILFLEMHKPVAGLAGNALIVLSPFVAPFVGIDNVHDYSRLLSNRASYEKLIVALEDHAEHPASVK